MNLTLKFNPIEFNQFLFGEIDLDLYEYKFLRKFIEKAQNGQRTLYDLSVINFTDHGWILIIHSERILIYGQNWKKEQFEEINEVFDLNIYSNYIVAGDSQLIDELIKFYKPNNFLTEKRRLFYHTNDTTIFDTNNCRIRLATLNELDELALMLQDYYHEEYSGTNDKEIEEMRKCILSMIKNRNIYVLLNSNDIISFCSIIDPEIGILFTKNEFRNSGYGKMILSHCSDLLSQRNGIVYLMTDQDRPQSNQVCQKVGFKPYFQFKSIKVNYD